MSDDHYTPSDNTAFHIEFSTAPNFHIWYQEGVWYRLEGARRWLEKLRKERPEQKFRLKQVTITSKVLE